MTPDVMTLGKMTLSIMIPRITTCGINTHSIVKLGISTGAYQRRASYKTTLLW